MTKMIDPIMKSETKVTFGPVRLSYVHLLERYKYSNESGDGKYSAVILIPKEERKTLAAIEKCVAAAKQVGVVKHWGGREPKKLALPLHDGDDRDSGGEEFIGVYYLNAKSSRRPNVVDRSWSPLTDEQDVYSGMWAYVSVAFFPYDNTGGKGVSVSIDSVMKYKDDTRFSGGSSAESDFAGLPPMTDDDDL